MKARLAIVLIVAGVLLSATSGELSATQVCQTVDAAAAAGVSFGGVIAGETYTYQASGCVGRNADGTFFDDPDGDEHSDPACTMFVYANTAPSGFTCPGLTSFSLVGKIGGGACFQLGSSGSFTASAGGTLVLYFNDDNYGDNSGSWNVCLSGKFPSIACQSVPAAASGGVGFGSVVAGHAYGYEATGCVGRNLDGTFFDDPNGNEHSDPACTMFIYRNAAPDGFTCPGLRSFSLVGKIGGVDCVQLGNHGAFVAPSDGELVLSFNDDIYGDNSGAWDVCVNEVIAVPVDVRPRKCPNQLSNSHRKINVAIVGTPTFDISQIDLATARLEGVAPLSATVKDVAQPFSPFLGKSHATDCSRKARDRRPDLLMTFDQAALLAALGPIQAGEVGVLHLSAELNDGTPIAGEDVVVVGGR